MRCICASWSAWSFECGGLYESFSQDHLDFFGTMENYFAAKKLLFSTGMTRNAAVNVDEETGAERLREPDDCPLLTYGISSKADLFARDIEITETGVSFTLNLRNLHAERSASAADGHVQRVQRAWRRRRAR